MVSKDKVPEKVQEALFAQILNRPGNGECADCGNKAPSWVSLDFGVFVCIRCSGVHRQLGPHITRVRSTRLDGWTKDNIEIMATIGNKLANDYYEYKMPTGFRKPVNNSTPEECRRFIDQKYIRKSFAPPGYQEPVREYLASRTKGQKPDFGYSKEQTPQGKTEKEPENNTKFSRKKSMSLEKLPESHPKAPENQQKKAQNQQQHFQDLLSADDDFLGGNSHTDPNGFGDFEQAHSASPVKTQGQRVEEAKPQQGNNQWNWNFDSNQQQQQQPQGPSNNLNQLYNAQTQQQAQGQNQMQNQMQNQQQKQADNKVDFMKLYNQPQPTVHQNHFMQMQAHQGWHQHQHHNQGWHSAPHNNIYMPNVTNIGNQGGFYPQQQGFPQQQQQQAYGMNQGFQGNMSYNNQMGYGMNGFGQGQMQMQMQGQQGGGYPNVGFGGQQMQQANNRFY